MADSSEQWNSSFRLFHAPVKVSSARSSCMQTCHHLPAPLTSLIGRANECEALCKLLKRPTVRLVTVTGPAGVGKTRLALAGAYEMRAHFEDGVGFVSLASVKSPDTVLPELLRVLRVKTPGEDSAFVTLVRALAKKHFLLVLDNLEHLAPAASLLLDLLQSCEKLNMLVTSRAVLHIPGEWIFPVQPLPLPEPVSGQQGNASLELFVERAQACRPDFQLTEQNAPALVKICRALDGLPLALELAATRMRLLTPQQLLERLSPRLELLAQCSSAIPERQQSMRGTIQWSYDLLNEQEQELFCRLSVFVEGCFLADLEALYARLGEKPGKILEGVTSLIEKNLLFADASEGSASHLSQLETFKGFGQTMLLANQQLDHVRAVHADYYASLVPEPSPIHLVLIQGARLEFLKRNYQNLLAALHFFEEQLDMTRALRLAIGMGSIWLSKGSLYAGMEELERAVGLCERQQVKVSPVLLSTACTVAGQIASRGMDLADSHNWYRRALLPGQVLENAALFSLSLPRLVEAEPGNHIADLALLEEALNSGQANSNVQDTARALCGLGYLALHRADLAGAQPLFEESIRALDQAQQIATYLAHIVASSLEGLAFIASEKHACHLAAILLGAADTQRHQGPSASVPDKEMDFRVRARNTTRQALGTSAFATAFSEGKSLKPSQAIALQDSEEDCARQPPTCPVPLPSLRESTFPQTLPSRPESLQPSGEALTRRETDVLVLLAQGLSNAQIAERLTLTVTTINSYLRSVYSKLGVTSRTAAMRYALDHRLV